MQEETYAARTEATPISTGFSSGAYAGSWKTVSQSRAAISSRIARLTWVFRPSQTSTSGTVAAAGARRPGTGRSPSR